jgi:hypothetical protein
MITHDYKKPRQRARMTEILFFTVSLIGFVCALIYAFYQI